MNFTADAIKITQGGRDMYASAMTMKEVDELLPVRLEEHYDQVTETNRPVDVKHVERIAKYIESKADWVLPPITLSVSEDALAFSDGKLTISRDVVIIDGQHRRLAIRARIRSLSDANREADLAAFLNTSLPFCLIVEASVVSTRQIFSDVAQSKAIDRLTRLEFDGTDPFNNVARQVSKDSELLSGKIHPTNGSTIRKGDEWLLSKTDIKTVVTVLALGLGKNASAEVRAFHRNDEREGELATKAMAFFDEFLPQSRHLFREIMDGGFSARTSVSGVTTTGNWNPSSSTCSRGYTSNGLAGETKSSSRSPCTFRTST